jgi:hypothetical protein
VDRVASTRVRVGWWSDEAQNVVSLRFRWHVVVEIGRQGIETCRAREVQKAAAKGMARPRRWISRYV